MKKLWCGIWICLICTFLIPLAGAQQKKTPISRETPKMRFLGKFDAGVPNAGIYKMYDASDDVVCYILMPDLPVTRQIAQGIMYEGNSIGAISCVKVKVHVVPMRER